jgi:hypothetical protein
MLTLKRWNPLHSAATEGGANTVTFDGEPPPDTILVDLHGPMATQRNLVTLHRAAQVNGLTDSLFETNSAMNGEPWYERLPRIAGMDIEAVVDDERMVFAWTGYDGPDADTRALLGAIDAGNGGPGETCEMGENAVTESIVVRLALRTGHDVATRRLATDFGVGTEYTTCVQDAGILVTRDCALDVESLRDLIAEAVFEVNDFDTDETPQVQWDSFLHDAHTVAAHLLLGKDEAIEECIRHAARIHLSHLLPDGRTVRLRKTEHGKDNCAIEVRLLPEDAGSTR